PEGGGREGRGPGVGDGIADRQRRERGAAAGQQERGDRAGGVVAGEVRELVIERRGGGGARRPRDPRVQVHRDQVERLVARADGNVARADGHRGRRVGGRTRQGQGDVVQGEVAADVRGVGVDDVDGQGRGGARIPRRLELLPYRGGRRG